MWREQRVIARMPSFAAADGLFDWTAFQVTWPLKTDLTGSPCGSVVASLSVRGDHTALTEARFAR